MDAACAALDALRGARVVAFCFTKVDDIPASTLSHHPSLTRMVFYNCVMPPPARPGWVHAAARPAGAGLQAL